MKKQRKMRLSSEDHVVNTISNIFVIVTMVATLYPMWYCLIIALNDNFDSIRGGIYLWPRVPTFDNIRTVVQNKGFLTAFIVTVSRTVVGTVFAVSSLIMASYAMSKKKLYFRNFYKGLLIFASYVGGGTIPYYLTLRNIHLLNTFWVYVLPSFGIGFFNVMLVQAFMRQLPEALEESAIIDGCGYFKSFLQVVMPLCTPIIATMALFAAVGHWNDWFSTNYYTTSPDLVTLAAYLQRLIAQEEGKLRNVADLSYGVDKNMLATKYLRYAALVVTITPILAVYPFCQKYFVKGMLIGSVKA